MTTLDADPRAAMLLPPSVSEPALAALDCVPAVAAAGLPSMLSKSRPLCAPGALPEAVDPLALALNENPFPPLASVRSAIVDSIGAANRYPEFYPQELRRMIAGHIGADEQQVVVGAGATGVILQVLQALTTPGDRVVYAAPTFDGYPIMARMARLESVTVPLDRAGCHQLDDLADAAATARVVAICRPHNPTGTVELGVALEQFLGRISADTIVLVDEAYAEFLAPQHRIDWMPLIRRHPNVVVVRTFSKAYGLAGLRIGYGFSSAEVAEQLWSMQLPFGIGLTSMVAVAASYQAEAQLRQRVRLITSERRKLRNRLHARGIHCTDSHANFLYLPAGDRPWQQALDTRGLRVRHFPDGAVRITIGARQSTRAVLGALRSQTREVG
jgi:histidinol-phosphate aminotransferase